MTRISFIMPTFNRAAYIAESIFSIAGQMDQNDELVIVDDGSTDNTAEVVNAMSIPLRYIRQTNAGKSVALNRAMEMTGGQYVWICDDDDLLLPGAVDELFTLLENGSAEMIFGRYTRFRMDGGSKVDMGVGYWPDLSSGSLARHILEDSFVMHNAALVTRAAYVRAGPFDPAMLRSQDYEMFVRLAMQSPVMFHDRLIFEQRKHDGARGPQSIVHAAGASAQIWEAFDRAIFQKLYDKVDIDFFESLVAANDPRLVRRAALLQRGCIMGRHGLWEAAFKDFAAAVVVAPNIGLTPVETAICNRTVQGKHGFEGLLTSDSLDRLERMRKSSVAGRALALALADGMMWQLRGQSSDGRRQAMAILGQRAGLRYGLPLIHSRLTRRAAGLGSQLVTEATEPRYISPAQVEALTPPI
ncbi:glycosyltransferase family 2 protein [Blastomonas aquatica]|uniref:Glycosyltransferase 2-like domain-containing protein n=1 Tax=Blastomonas aquatica TaxID=1510276 RepID=A0ABQ1JVH6_9SPHN|nr:glycosyltransferase family 2 protein [Blastomonas aquatica]GGB75688.1 hypothetical protein GCM10010833_33680 [Blastomonas aquatica]